MPRPKSKSPKVNLNLHIDPEVKETLTFLASKKGTSISLLVAEWASKEMQITQDKSENMQRVASCTNKDELLAWITDIIAKSN